MCQTPQLIIRNGVIVSVLRILDTSSQERLCFILVVEKKLMQILKFLMYVLINLMFVMILLDAQRTRLSGYPGTSSETGTRDRYYHGSKLEALA